MQPPQPPLQGQQPPQPYPGQYPQYPYYQPQMPPPAKSGKKTILIVVTVLIVAAAGLGVAAYVLRGPAMAITNFQLTDERSCGAFGSGNGYVAVTFDLVNTGGNGFATIAYTLDGVTDHSNAYHVPGGTSLPIHDSVFVSDCNAHTAAAQITAETAG